MNRGPSLRRLAGLLGAGILLVAACTTAPITGRSQLILFPAAQDAALGADAYRQILAMSRISNDPVLNRRVREVGQRIARASGQPDLDWEYTVIEDDTPNAFALPGGKVGVHTGLFTVAMNDAQLAAVMGHEVGHVIARHGSERMSQQVLLQGGLAALGAGAAGSSNQEQYVRLAVLAATLGVVLPFSREQESEADQIGLIYMARAGYDPRQSVELWRNFEAQGQRRQLEFLSTHPAPGTRIAQLQAQMPEAMAIYEQNRQP